MNSDDPILGLMFSDDMLVVRMPCRSDLWGKGNFKPEFQEWMAENAPGTTWTHRMLDDAGKFELFFVFTDVRYAIHFKLMWVG